MAKITKGKMFTTMFNIISSEEKQIELECDV
jgi:hypothetical protein